MQNHLFLSAALGVNLLVAVRTTQNELQAAYANTHGGWHGVHAMSPVPSDLVPYQVPLSLETSEGALMARRLLARWRLEHTPLGAHPAFHRTMPYWPHRARDRVSRDARRVIGLAIAAAMRGDEDYDDQQAVVDNLRACSRPGDVVALWNSTTSGDYAIAQCEDCGSYECDDDMHYVGANEDRAVCDSCRDEYVEARNYMGDVVVERRSNVYQHSDGEYYTYQEDDEDDEDDDEETDGLYNYSQNPLHYVKPDRSIQSSCYGDFLMGIELEVETTAGRHRRAAVQDTKQAFQDYAIMKRDGSLSESCGFEIVTAPRGLAEHIRRFKAWEPHEELVSWDSGDCGTHVHIDANAFTRLSFGKFVEFINRPENDAFIRAIAGRSPETSEGCAEYANRERRLTIGNPVRTARGKNMSRYHMVNAASLDEHHARRLGIENWRAADGHGTVELRVFRGTLNKKRFLAQIEFAHAAVMFCRVTSMQRLHGRDFLRWLEDNAANYYPHLAKWFGIRTNGKVKASDDALATKIRECVHATEEEV